MYYECLWYINEECYDYDTKSFKSKKAALNYYNKHKDDKDRFMWWVTKRDEYGFVVDDIII